MSQTNPAYVIERSLDHNKGSKVCLWDHNRNMGPEYEGRGVKKVLGSESPTELWEGATQKEVSVVFIKRSQHTHICIYMCLKYT